MAELTYDDVKRATQDAVRNLQDMKDVAAELRSSHDDIRRNIQQIDVLTNRFNNLQNQFNTLQQQLTMQTTVVRTLQTSLQTMQAWQNVINDMARRIALIEQMARTTYQYLGIITDQMTAAEQQSTDKR